MAEFLVAGNRDAEDILLSAAGREEFQQSDDLYADTGGIGSRNPGSRGAGPAGRSAARSR